MRLDGFRDLITRRASGPGAGYPWWLPAGVAVVAVAVALTSIGQRGAFAEPGWSVAGGLAAAVPFVCAAASHRQWPAALASVTLIGVGLMLVTDPVEFDMAPTLLMLLAAVVTALYGTRAGMATTAASIALLAVVATAAWLPDAGINLVGVVLGFDVGFTMRWQQRAMTAERERRKAERAAATDAERRRIAREIHDVVGHSLSVIMLHLTGARHVLQSDHDVDEAITALAEAERVGRGAMADIRRTVGLLAVDGATPTVLPGLCDVAELVDSVRAAGVEASYHTRGRPPDSPAIGLALYRMVQESLANVAKHAPYGRASVRLVFTDTEARLTVENDLAAGIAAPAGSTTPRGIDGMAARSAQLGGDCHAGPSPDRRRWIVEAVIPLGAPETVPPTATGVCPVRKVIK